jgi:aminoglycoside N3'-acetyltransferase
MSVTVATISQAVRILGLSGQPICIHCSLASHGLAEGGASTIIGAVLAESCTILVPTFSWDAFAVSAPPAWCLDRSGWPPGGLHPWSDVAFIESAAHRQGRAFSPEANSLDRDMDALPAAVLSLPQRLRGNHLLNSFAAVGPLARSLVDRQTRLDVWTPLRALAQAHGSVLLMGVGLNRMSLLHLAEHMAGRWAIGREGHPIEMEVGSCSEGFGQLQPMLAPIRRATSVGPGMWQVFPATETLESASSATRSEPRMTHCGNVECRRCDDAILGGPILDQ